MSSLVHGSKPLEKEKNMFILLIKNGDKLVGITPLMACKSSFRGLPVKSIQFMSNDNSPACGFIIKKDCEQIIEAIIYFLIKDFKNWDVIFLENLLNDTDINNCIFKTIEQARTCRTSTDQE